MNPSPLQQAQILSALQVTPLDRVRLMKTLFLFWHRSGRSAFGPFRFRPYLYGPCAFDLYAALDAMEARGLIVQAPHPVNRWAPFHITNAGRHLILPLASEFPPSEQKRVSDIASWAAKQDFQSLLRHVYEEAPDYATESVFQSEGTLHDSHRRDSGE